MTGIETDIERAYRNAVAETPYSSISVMSLCEEAGVSRKMFYKRFKNKNDILRYIFNRDVVDPQIELCHLLSFEKMGAFAPKMEQHMFRAVRNNGVFYRNLVNAPGGGEEAFAEIAVDAFRHFNLIILDAFAFRGSQAEADYVATFFAEGKARLMAKWARENFPISVLEASNLYSRMALPFWNTLL